MCYITPGPAVLVHPLVNAQSVGQSFKLLSLSHMHVCVCVCVCTHMCVFVCVTLQNISQLCECCVPSFAHPGKIT